MLLVFTGRSIGQRDENIDNNVAQRGARWWDFEPETLQRFFPFTTHTASRANYSCDNAHLARWARMREPRTRWTLFLLLGLILFEAINVFSAWIWRGKNIFGLWIFNILYCIPLPLIHNKLTLVNTNNLR